MHPTICARFFRPHFPALVCHIHRKAGFPSATLCVTDLRGPIGRPVPWPLPARAPVAPPRPHPPDRPHHPGRARGLSCARSPFLAPAQQLFASIHCLRGALKGGLPPPKGWLTGFFQVTDWLTNVPHRPLLFLFGIDGGPPSHRSSVVSKCRKSPLSGSRVPKEGPGCVAGSPRVCGGGWTHRGQGPPGMRTTGFRGFNVFQSRT